MESPSLEVFKRSLWLLGTRFGSDYGSSGLMLALGILEVLFQPWWIL